MSNFFNREESFVIENENSLAKNYIANVFLYMFFGLGATGFISWYFGQDFSRMAFMFKENPYSGYDLNIIGYVVMFAPLALVFLMGGAYHKFSSSSLKAVFFGFAAVMGLSLSTIFIVYTASSIASTFFITGGLFGVMAFLGYTTKTDLTKFGSFLMMALIGIIIASFVNWFTQSSTLYYIISFGGVIIFTGLTAYDVQKLKHIGSNPDLAGEEKDKSIIMGALSLYLDFINLFLFLLRFLGNRD